MAWRGTVDITEMLNRLADWGVFAYVIPFLLIFAVVFALLQRTGILAKKAGDRFEHNTAMEGIVAAAIGLLALQFDFVSTFFATIFPRFGVGLAIFLVLMILVGFFFTPNDGKNMSWVGWLTGAGVVIWAWTSWDDWFGMGGMYGIGDWFTEYLPMILVLGVVIGVIAFAVRKPTSSGGKSSG